MAAASLVPERSNLGGALAIAAGDAHTLAVSPDGSVRAFGANGALGNGTSTASATPADRLRITRVTDPFGRDLRQDQRYRLRVGVECERSIGRCEDDVAEVKAGPEERTRRAFFPTRRCRCSRYRLSAEQIEALVIYLAARR